ncbi:MAG: hypothetical protein QM756_12385 [Polyangiaceae bacterium]
MATDDRSSLEPRAQLARLHTHEYREEHAQPRRPDPRTEPPPDTLGLPAERLEAFGALVPRDTQRMHRSDTLELDLVAELDTLRRSSAPPPPAGKFPRSSAVLHLAELSARMRFCGAVLDALAANASAYEPATLRAHASAMVAALIDDLNQQVRT